MKKFHLIIILFLTLFGNAACGQNYTPDVLIGNILATVVGVFFALQIFNRERLLYSM